jgi:hypothetical protein
MWDHNQCMLIDNQRMNNFQHNNFCENQKYESTWLLKVKIDILFYGDNSWNLNDT